MAPHKKGKRFLRIPRNRATPSECDPCPPAPETWFSEEVPVWRQDIISPDIPRKRAAPDEPIAGAPPQIRRKAGDLCETKPREKVSFFNNDALRASNFLAAGMAFVDQEVKALTRRINEIGKVEIERVRALVSASQCFCTMQEVDEHARLLGFSERAIECVHEVNNECLRSVVRDWGPASTKATSVCLAIAALHADGFPVFAFNVKYLALVSYVDSRRFPDHMEEMMHASPLARALFHAARE